MSLKFEELPQLISCWLEPPSLRGPLGSSTIDTRILKAGDLFWALKGEEADGHDYVDEAFSKGACAAVVRENWFQSRRDRVSRGSYVVVSETLGALQDLAKAHRSRFDLPVIALTGSNGKTATKELLAAALSRKYKLLKSPGNYNNYIGLPLTLLQMDAETQMVLTEMGTNQPGDIKRLCDIARPEFGLVLNVGPAHLEGFGDLAGVAREKGMLLASLPPTGAAFVNTDDPYVRAMASPAKTRVCFGFNGGIGKVDCDLILKAENLGAMPQSKGRFRLRDVEFTLNWHGRHQVHNALAAAAVADYLDVPLRDIAHVFASMPPLPGRLTVEMIAGITLIDDSYNANPASTSVALELLKSMDVAGKKYAALGDHLELGAASENQHRRFGKMLAQRWLDGVFLVGPQMRYAQEEAPDLVRFYLEDESNLEPLIAEVIRMIRPGDALLVKASRGMRLERIVQRIKRHFTEDQG